MRFGCDPFGPSTRTNTHTHAHTHPHTHTHTHTLITAIICKVAQITTKEGQVNLSRPYTVLIFKLGHTYTEKVTQLLITTLTVIIQIDNMGLKPMSSNEYKSGLQ